MLVEIREPESLRGQSPQNTKMGEDSEDASGDKISFKMVKNNKKIIHYLET